MNISRINIPSTLTKFQPLISGQTIVLSSSDDDSANLDSDDSCLDKENVSGNYGSDTYNSTIRFCGKRKYVNPEVYEEISEEKVDAVPIDIDGISKYSRYLRMGHYHT